MKQDDILIVDNDPHMRDSMARVLRGEGYNTDAVASAAAAMHYLAQRSTCPLIISAVSLQEMSGFALLESVRALSPDAAFVLAGESEDYMLAVEAFRSGAADLLLKPVTASALLGAVSRALNQRRSRVQTIAYCQNLEQMVTHRTEKLRQTMLDLEQSYDITLEAMGDALDLRDEETEGHSKRVTAYTIALARAMRLSSDDLKTIARGAFLHDIGKIAIPDSILLKPGKLTEDEMLIMQSHCARGYATVRKIPFLSESAEIVYAHQEAFDGSGYPRGLRGEAIPLGARIFAIADTLDAITSDRPYRKGATYAYAIAEIERCRGRQFDPRIVDVFLSLPRETWPLIRAEVGRHSHAAELVRAAAA